jgi:hypothetical protein
MASAILEEAADGDTPINISRSEESTQPREFYNWQDYQSQGIT